MAEHRFDPVAFVFGVAVLASVARREPWAAAAVESSAATGDEDGDDHSDLDDRFAPVDDVLPPWQTEPAPDADAVAEQDPAADDAVATDPTPGPSTTDDER